MDAPCVTYAAKFGVLGKVGDGDGDDSEDDDDDDDDNVSDEKDEILASEAPEEDFPSARARVARRTSRAGCGQSCTNGGSLSALLTACGIAPGRSNGSAGGELMCCGVLCCVVTPPVATEDKRWISGVRSTGEACDSMLRGKLETDT